MFTDRFGCLGPDTDIRELKIPISIYQCRCVYHSSVPVKSLDALPINVTKLSTGTVNRIQYIYIYIYILVVGRYRR